MLDDELKLLINELEHKYGTDTKMKQKLCLILKELLKRYEDLDKRYPELKPVGRPRKEA